MNLAPRFKTMLFTFVFSIFLFISCSQENDLFTDAVNESIEKEIQEEDSENEGTESGEGNPADDTPAIDDDVSSDLRAFPTADGFGRYVSGGRGGEVIKVTTTEDGDYEGTLRWALTRTYPRTVLFSVGGTFELDYFDQIRVTNGDLTIAGQSAPSNSGGVTIKGSIRLTNADNVIIRYVRFRLGDNGYRDAAGRIQKPGASIEFDGLEIVGGGNIIVDHCSISWAIDENLGIARTSNVTIQNCIVSEGLMDSAHYEGELHSMGALISSSERISFVRNYFAHNNARNVRSARSAYELVNNVFYGFNEAGGMSDGQKFVLIGNHWEERTSYPTQSRDVTSYIKDNRIEDDLASVYERDNSTNYAERILRTQWESYRVQSPDQTGTFSNLFDEIYPASNVVDAVLKDVGAVVPYVDSVDKRVVSDFFSQSGKIIDTQEEVGGYPQLSSGTAQKDTDEDGIPDSWEEANGLDKNRADENEDKDGDGYTNLEEYLNLLGS